LQINMMGLGGLEVALWSSQADLSWLYVDIENSLIEFYVNGTKVSDLNCSSELTFPSYSHHQPASNKHNLNNFFYRVFLLEWIRA
jgi:hypothetical protein